VFLGWGASEREDDVQLARAAREAEDEETASRDYTPPLMIVVPAVLLIGSIVLGLIPGVVPSIEVAASHFQDHAAYARWVLQDVPAHFGPAPTSHVETFDYLYAAGGTLGALALAALTLFGYPMLARVPGAILGPPRAAVSALRELHSGHIGDYIAWWTAGTAALGGASLVLLR
jgi:multicomponent Na+:H+ antiporter subunit D